MEDLRARLDKALDSLISDDLIKEVITMNLAATKKAWVHCPHCKKKSQVDIPDAKASSAAIAELANQAKGRPGESQGSDEEKINFERVVYLGGDEA